VVYLSWWGYIREQHKVHRDQNI